MNKEAKHLLLASVAISVVLSTIFGGAAGFNAGWYLASKSEQAPEANQQLQNAQLDYVDVQSAIVDVVDKSSPAVVSIIITKDLPKINSNSPFMNDPFFRQFFGDRFDDLFGQDGATGDSQRREIGGGTGFIVSPDGYIVTNKHVVDDTEAEYTVLMGKDKRYTAKVLARDPMNDLAILKIDAANLPTIVLGDSSGLKVGQTVIAIGNALGEFRNTVSAGIISGLARSITAGGAGRAENLVGVIQTDASINSGNSGGPLIDINGQVIGINTAVAQGAQGIGFAIPINEVKKTIDDVRQHGRIVRPWLGVRFLPIDEAVKEANQLPVDYGALIVRGNTMADLAIVPGSPADKAGLLENDILLEVNGAKINGENLLPQLIARHKAGDEINIKILRKAKEQTIKVRLEEIK